MKYIYFSQEVGRGGGLIRSKHKNRPLSALQGKAIWVSWWDNSGPIQYG